MTATGVLVTLALLPVPLLAAARGAGGPTVVEAPAPEYPDWARGAGLRTTVELRVLVGTDGRVRAVRVVPYDVRDDILSRPLRATFDSAAVRAVRRWRYRPATVAGRPAATWTRVEVPFEDSSLLVSPEPPTPPHRVAERAVFRALIGTWTVESGSGDRVRREGTSAGARIAFRPDSTFAVWTGDEIVESGRFDVTTNSLPERVEARVGRSWTHPQLHRRADFVAFGGADTLMLCGRAPGWRCDTLVRMSRP